MRGRERGREQLAGMEDSMSVLALCLEGSRG